MKKKLLFILMMLLVSTFLFANGVKEVAGDETVVKVLSVSADEPGVYRARVQTEDGNVIVYLASETDTVCSVPFAQIHEGSVLAVRDNGISTRSIPPQMYATEIRDLTLAAALGAYDFTFAQPTFDVLSEESTTAGQLWDITVSDDPQQRFSYSYGYDLVKGYVDQAVVFRGAAFARGVLDFWNGNDPLIPVESMAEDVNLYISTIFSQGIQDQPGAEPTSIEEIQAITEFSDLSERFSYAYGFVTGYQDYLYGITVEPVSFIEGALSAIYGYEPLLDEVARTEAVNTYVNQLMEDYMAQLETMAAQNLQRAENFLAENALVEGMISTDSGLQYEVVREGDGASPAADDTVIVNYTLRDIDGNQIESATDAQFNLSSLIPGFAEVVQTMKVGGETIAYMHPDLAYGQNGAGSVEPNSLLIFDIELTGILEPTV